MAFVVISLLTGACAALLCFPALRASRKAFEEYQRRYVAPSLEALGAMFLFLEARQLVRLNLAAVIVLAAAGLLMAGPAGAAAAAVAGFFAPALAVRVCRRRRIRRFESQLAEALQQMASALRAGLTLQQTVEQVGPQSAAPLRQEFALFTREVKLGVPVDAALEAMARRVGSPDMDLVAISAGIARQLGGNLAEMLECVAATLRERFRLEGRIAALTSQGKLQGIIVASLPLFVGLFLSSYRPDLVEPMFEGAYGYVLIAAIVLLQGMGFLAIRRIVAIDV
ncbi:MAG TPA: type II secretion system F family protein [Myxococcales bacterium]|nr:type II secretion system F family protein [Myxococcales bacterium]